MHDLMSGLIRVCGLQGPRALVAGLAVWAGPMTETAIAQVAPVIQPGQFIQSGPPPEAQSAVDFETDEPFSATYVAADIKAVAAEILGEFLKLDYSVAPDVSGLVTLRMENVRSRLAAIDALRTAAAPLGVALIDRGDVVAITRATGQPGGSVSGAALAPGETAPPGSGAAVITPQHIPPSELAPLLAPFAAGATIPVVDDRRRFLIVRGDETALNAASAAAAMFDVDWHRQISRGVFRLNHVTPNELVREMGPLLGPSAALVELVSVPRLSSLVVLARSPEAYRTASELVATLDVANASTVAGLLVYRARHASAESLAGALRDIGPGEEGTVSAVTGASASGLQSPQGLAGTAAQNSSSRNTYSVAFNLAQNAVIVRGDATQLSQAKGLLESLDQRVPQVLIEAAILEVTLNDELQFGVNWRGIEDRLTATFTDAANGAVSSRFPGLALTYINTDIEAAINLLASIARVEVVSRPSIMALNNETAELQVGDQVPIVTQTAISVTDPDAPIVNQTVYRDTGVILTVTPSVRSGGVIELKVDQEVSQVARTTSSGIDSPTIQQRRIESKLVVPSGRSVALGGLISTTRTDTKSGVPLLKDIPLLGRLFRTEEQILQRTELIVLLTPRVLAEPDAAVEATDQLRAAFRDLERELAPR